MNLCEEYIKRHNINIPYVPNIDWGSLFFKIDDQWRILVVNWKEASNHPGYYTFRTLKPVHDGWYAGKYFDRSEEQVVNLDNYEDYVLRFVSSVKRCPNKDEIISIAWEMSLYIFDSLIAKDVSSYVCKFDSNKLEFDDFVYWLSQKVMQFGNFWESDMESYVNGHMNWLGEMVKRGTD